MVLAWAWLYVLPAWRHPLPGIASGIIYIQSATRHRCQTAGTRARSRAGAATRTSAAVSLGFSRALIAPIANQRLSYPDISGVGATAPPPRAL